MKEINENILLGRISSCFKRSPAKINSFNESDAEIISLGDEKRKLLAITTDSISEEIKIGLYSDPYLAGWMIVTANLSDIAAVGADPLGVMISEILPKNFSNKNLNRLQRGISDACSAHNTFVLGGDTNFGDELMLSGTAIGTLDNNNYNSRLGAAEGDSLFVSGYAGSGNMFAFLKLFTDKKINYEYQPTAQIKEGLLLKNFNACCIDSSDGVLAAVDQLMRLNNVGFALDHDWQYCITGRDCRLAEKYKLPLWFLLAGIHGEFKLVFTIPDQQEILFRKDADSIGWQPIKLGRVIREQKIIMPVYGKMQEIKTGLIRNAGFNSVNSLTSYLKLLKDIDYSLI